MGIHPVQLAQVQVHPGFPREGLEEFFHQLRVKCPDLFRWNLRLQAQAAAAGQVHCAEDERFVHGQDAAAVAADAALVAQRLAQRLAQDDADVLDAVVVVDLGVAGASQGQIKAAVLGKEGQHMVQKADAGLHLACAGAVQAEAKRDGGLRCRAVDLSSSHGGIPPLK